MLFLNVMPMMRLFYARDVIGKADEMTAFQIARELEEFPASYEGKPVIFIGHKEAMTNNACYEDCEEYSRSVYTSFSAFAMDYAFEPYYYFSTHRILCFLKTLGIRDFREPSAEMMPFAYEDSENMPIWPLEGSVKEFDDYIIVKLGAFEFAGETNAGVSAGQVQGMDSRLRIETWVKLLTASPDWIWRLPNILIVLLLFRNKAAVRWEKMVLAGYIMGVVCISILVT